MEIDFNQYCHNQYRSLLDIRYGETKLGEINLELNLNDNLSESIHNTNSKFIILGVEESIGPLANLGNKGAENAFVAFLKAFLNIQVNRFFDPNTVRILGSFKVQNNSTDVNELRSDVAVLDYKLSELLSLIFKANKIPILIGGGHNNSFPLIKSFYESYHKKINILNIDPHADFRAREGRHSGNGFSYAYEEGFIDHYLLFGIHESYNSENMLKELEKSANVLWLSFEEILDQDTHPFIQFKRFIERIEKTSIGLEIDLDCIAHFPVSAYSPVGFSLEDVRKKIRYLASLKNVRYLHLPEGAPNNEKEKLIVGKGICYLVTDFIKSYL